MKENPIERLNYFNGQRLEAVDFRLEQDYHVRVQRWLSRALFSPGIGMGLEVIPIDPGTLPATRIVVTPGLALDDLGRAIILTDPEILFVTGPILTIAYTEERTAPEYLSCDRPAETARWGGPSRIIAKPRLGFRDRMPPDDSHEIPLAKLVLDADCRVRYISTAPRRHAVPGSSTGLRKIAMEGEKDIDQRNPKRIYVHVSGGRPRAVTLYLRAAQLSTLFYTELGQHDHGTYTVGAATGVDAHAHALLQLTTTGAGDHTHAIFGNTVGPPGGLTVVPLVSGPSPPVPSNLYEFANVSLVPAPQHTHVVEAGLTDSHVQVTPGAALHVHQLSHISSVSPGAAPASGGLGASARTGPQLTFLDDLHIEVDHIDVTDAVIAQLTQLTSVTWTKLGDGTATHPLVAGTGAIRLDFLPDVEFPEGEHTITLSVRNASGGRVLYNLYVD